MSVIAEFTLAPGHLSFAAALSAAPSVELDVEREYARSAMPVVFCWVRGGDLDAFEEGLADDTTVTDIDRLSDSGDRRLYRVCLTGAAPVVVHTDGTDVRRDRYISFQMGVAGRDIVGKQPVQRAVGARSRSCVSETSTERGSAREG